MSLHYIFTFCFTNSKLGAVYLLLKKSQRTRDSPRDMQECERRTKAAIRALSQIAKDDRL